jgi:hypothetical protein
MSTSFRPREAFEPIGEQPKMSGCQEGAFYEKKFIHRRAILSAGLLTTGKVARVELPQLES